MKKLLSMLMLVAAMLLPWASRAQDGCTPISTFPVSYGFEASEGFTASVTSAAACTTNVFNSCWRNEQTTFNGTTGSGRIWHIYGGTTVGQIHGGVHSLMLPDKGSSTAGVSTTMLVFPPMDFTYSGGYVVTFWIYRNGTSTTASPEGFKVYASDTDTIGPNAVELGHYSRHYPLPYPSAESAAGWYQYETVPITLSGTVYLIFEGQSYYSSSTYIDDVVIMEAPTCIKVSNLTVDATQTTTNSLTLRWSDAFNASPSYSVYMFTANDTTLVQSGITDTSYTVSNLSSGTSYTFAVVTDCGNGDTSMFSSMVTAYTACGTITSDDLPYNEDFESYGTGSANPIHPCWHKGVVALTGSGTTINYPYPYSTAAIHGTRGLYFYAAKTASTSYYNWLALPPIDETLNMSDLMVTFSLKRTATATHLTTLVVGVTTNYTTAAGFVPVDTIDLSTAGTGTVHDMEVSFANYSDTGRYVLFYAPAPATSTKYNAFYLDDISLKLIPSCFRPTEVRVDDVQTDEVTLSWTPDSRTTNPSSWQIEYGEEGFVSGTGTTEYSGDTTVTITSLDPSTRYEFRVSADCGNEISEERSIVVATLCEPLELPYYENFNGMASLANGDGVSMTGDAPTCWDMLGSSGSYIALYSTTTYLYGGTGYSLKFRSGVNNEATYLILPPFEEPTSSLELTFQTRPEGTSASSGVFEVGYMTNPTVASSFVVVQHYDYSDFSGAYEQRAVTFPNAPDSSRIAMRHIPTSASWFWFVDEVDVHMGPSCQGPQNIVINGLTDMQATLVITDINHEDNYIITLQREGDTNIDTYTTTSESYTFTGLNSNTMYHVTVVTDCGDGSYTTAMRTDFRTACTPIADTALPYIEDFETYTSGSSNPISPCWTKAVFGTTTQYPYPYGTAAMSGSIGLYGYGSAAIYDYAALPLFATPINQLALSFSMRRYSTQSYQTRVLVGVMSNPSDLSTFDTIEDIDITAEAPSTIHRINVSFAGYNGTGNIAFFFPKASNGASYNAVYIDSVVVDALPTCVWPSSLAAEVIDAHSIALTWNGTASNYYIEYSYHQNFDSIVGSTTVNTNSAVLTGLDSYKWHYFRVRSVCGDDYSIWSQTASAQTPIDCGLASVNIIDTIGNGTSTSSTYVFYSSTSYRSGVTSSIFTAQELNEMGLQTNNRLNGIKIHSGSTGGTIRKVKVYVKEVALDGYTASTDSVNRNTMTLVYSGDLVVPASSWVEIPFDNAFAYSGNSNLLVSLYRDSTCSAAITFYYTSTTPDYLSYYGCRSTASAANNTFNRTYYRPNMIFNFCTEIPACVRPSNVAASATDTVVTLNWTGTAASYDVVLSSTSIDPDSTAGLTPLTTTANNITIGGLLPSTTYYYYVRANCGGMSGSSEWSLEGSIATACAAKTLPYTEDFESYTSGAANPIDPCWEKGTNSSTAYPYPYSTNAVSGYRSLYFYAYRPSTATATAYYSYAALPLMEDSVKNLALSMNVRRYSSVADNYTSRLVIGVMTNPADITTFFAMDTLDLKNEAALSVHGYEYFFDNYTGDGQYIAIYNEVPPLYGTSTTSYSYAYVDDIVVDRIPTCPRPKNVALDSVGETTATIRWTSAAGSYDIEYGPQGFSHGSGTTVSTTENSITLTGLSQGLTYNVYVRAHCTTTDTSDWSFAYAFTTVCGINQLPYTEDFESYGTGAAFAIDPCWVKGTNSATAYPYPYSTSAVTGNRSLYFYASHPSSGTEYYSYAALPLMADSVKNLKLSFNVRRYGTVSNTYTTRLVIGVMTNPNNIGTFYPMDTLDLQQAEGSSIHGYEFCFNNYTGNGQYIAIYDAVPPLYGTATTCYSYAYVDDIVVDHIPSCLRPTNVTMTGVTHNAATVHWTGNAAMYEVEYGEQGFAQSMGTTVTTTADSIALTGLQNSTGYDVYVRGICSATDNSEWSFVRSFATECGPNPLPMVFDPDNYATGTGTPLPLCWNRVNNATGTVNYYPYIYGSAANAHTGTNTLYYYFSTSSGYANDELMAFPEVDTVDYPMNTVEVSFWGKSSVTGKKIQVGVMTNPTNASTFQVVDTVVLTTTSTEYFVSFDNFAGSGAYVALRGVMEGSTAYYLYLDDIVIAPISHCPRSYNLTAYNGTANGATLAWTDTIGSTQWVVEYGRVNDSTTSTVTASSNPYTLTGLTPNSYYYYRVAPICPDGIQASMSTETCYFTTSQVPATMPYSYDFEAAAEWSNWQTSSNNTVGWYRGNVANGDSTNAMYLSADNGATHDWNMNAVSNVVAYRDIDFGTDTHSYRLDFDAYIGGTIGHDYDGIAVVLADPAMPVVSSGTGLTTPWGHINSVGLGTVRHDTTWGQHTIYLDGVAGVRRVVFYHFNQATGTNYPYENNPSAIDNVSISLQACERPAAMTSNVVDPYTVQLGWWGDDSAQYQICYRVKGSASSTNVYQTVTGTTALVTGLTPATTYSWWARKICTLTASDTLISAWTNPYRFTTPCVAISVADTLHEGFEGIAATGTTYSSTTGLLPNCWNSWSSGGATVYPHITNADNYSYWVEGNAAITLTSAGNSTSYGSNSYVVMPEMVEPTNALTLAFWYCTEGSSATVGELAVGYVTGDDYNADFVPVRIYTPSTTSVHSGNGLQVGTGVRDTVSFDSVPDGNYRLAFRWYKESTFYSCCLDDISVWANISCPAPVIVSQTVDYESAAITISGTSGNYELAYGTDISLLSDTMTSTTGMFNVTGLQPSTTYHYAVRQICDSGDVSNWTLGSFVTDDLPCTVVTGLQVTNISYTSASFSWNAGADETAWEVKVASTVDSVIVTVYADSATVDSLVSQRMYNVTVRPLCGSNQDFEGPWCEPETFTTDACLPVSNVTVSDITEDGATVAWTAPEGAENFRVAYGLHDFSVGDEIDIINTSANPFALSGLDENTPYTVRVAVVCTQGLVSSYESADFTTAEHHEGIFGVDNDGALSLYPNPASTKVTLRVGEQLVGSTVSIVDVNGREVMSEKLDRRTLTIDLSQLAKGAYFVRLTGEQATVVRKLIVK